ncbi:MAG: choice-of-anchor J domain-containing protein, partial [Bacteroidaceae bacterium]|nr:choice-of-anchor J domain-containing protein [Bacteroidaceae bacterium]
MKHFNFIKGFLLALMFVCAAQVKADENILVNGGFEEWSAGALTAWGKDGSNASAHSATIAQSTDACSGSYAVEVSGNSSGNKRLASKAYTLAAGTYTLSAYIKQSGEAAGKFRLGYAVIENGAIDSKNGYIYLTEATDATSDWECHSAEFTLEEETTVSILVMNNKLGKGASFLVDDVVVTGGNGETPGQPEEPEEPETPVEPETPAGVYISEALTSSFGTFTTQETVGNYPWEIATQYQCAKVTGYKGSANAAESWMVSKSFDLSKETAAYISFDYVIAYNSDDINGCHKVVFSHDYAGDVSKATWKEIDYSPVKSGVWTLENTGKIAIPSEMYGKENVVVAFKYTSSASKASTWEVANVVVASGTGNAPEQPEEPETPETLVCTVTEALAAFVAGEAKPAVVKGYIVGSIDGKSIDDANFSGTAVSTTNLLIADDADETDITKCLPVQLPGGAVRNALNLVENPGNYKKLVSLTGSLEKYFGIAGLKGVKEYSFDGDAPV